MNHHSMCAGQITGKSAYHALVVTNSAARTVIFGAGVAGGLAALAAARAGCQVVLIDTDGQSSWGSRRPGVPHADHLHNLLGRALSAMAEIAPELPGRLRDAGATVGQVSTDTYVYELGVVMPRRDVGLEICSISRAAVEAAVHAELALHPVEVVCGRAVGVVTSNGAVSGARVDPLGDTRREAPAQAPGDVSPGERTVPADLVIDCTGAATGAARWLADVDAPLPELLTVPIRQWYATAFVRHVGEPPFHLVFPTPPHTRGGLISRIDRDLIKVSLNGVAADKPPRTEAEFTAYAESLEDPSVGEALRAGTYVAPPLVYTKPRATWRRYDDVAGPLVGFLPLGDAVASLNPLFGQGISGIAWEASRLSRHLTAGLSPAQLTSTYLAEVGAIRRAMWALMTVFDPETGLGLTSTDVTKIATSVMGDARIHRRYAEVWHLLAPVSELTAIARGQLTSPGGWGAIWE